MTRKLKVYEQSMSGSSYTQVSTIILKGQWLKAAGFEAGQYVEVVCEGDKITLSKTTAPEPTTKKSLEDKINNLDKSQREKLSRMIDASDIATVPADLFAKFQISFYSNLEDAVIKALGIE